MWDCLHIVAAWIISELCSDRWKRQCCMSPRKMCVLSNEPGLDFTNTQNQSRFNRVLLHECAKVRTDGRNIRIGLRIDITDANDVAVALTSKSVVLLSNIRKNSALTGAIVDQHVVPLGGI